MLVGHIAISVLQHRCLDTELVPSLLGGLFPDALDKTLCQVLRITPSGRMWGHTLLGLGLTTILVGAVRGRRAARSWALGYAGHLAADTGGKLPLLYPFMAYEFEPSPGFSEIVRRFLSDRQEVALEFGLLAAALVWMRRAEASSTN